MKWPSSLARQSELYEDSRGAAAWRGATAGFAIYCTSHCGAVLALLRMVLCRARLHALYRRLEQACARYSDARARAFDLEHGTETFARIHLRDLGLGGGYLQS